MKNKIVYFSIMFSLFACKAMEDENKKFVKELTESPERTLRTEAIISSSSRTVDCYSDKIYLKDKVSGASQTLFTFDGSLTDRDRVSVCTDITSLNSVNVKNTTKDSLSSSFDSIFSGKMADGRTDFLAYLYDRVIYLVANSKRDTGNTSSQVIATNVGTQYWLHSIASARPYSYMIAGTQVSIQTPRVGIVELNAYSGFPTTERMSTMIHEARHSDCEKGFTDSDYKKLKSGNVGGIACGHLHIKCPVGHELAGQAACDPNGMGAYGVNAIFEKKMYQNCSNCSEKDKQTYLMMSNESFSRVIDQSLVAGRVAP